VVLPWMPVIDGTEVPMNVMDAFERGAFAKVPMLLGSNQDEGDMFTYQIDDYFDNLEYSALILALFKESAADVLNMYPPPLDPVTNVIELLSKLVTHYLFSCSTRHIANLTAAAVPQTFLYHFDHVLSFSQAWGPNYKFCVNKSCHGSELPFVFASAPLAGFAWGPGEEALADAMVLYWTNFAKTGNVNTPQSPPFQWPPFSSSLAVNGDAHFMTPPQEEAGYLQKYCDFWDGLGYDF